MSGIFKSIGFMWSYMALGWGLLTWGLFVVLTMNTTGQAAAEAGASAGGALSSFEMEHGIGPITTTVTLGELNPDLAKKGEAIFDLKCYACHRIDKRLVGPPLGDVLERRKPEFVLNMMLNPEEMQKKHPVVQKLLAEYMTVMTFQNITQDDAMAILEYLRASAQTDSSATP